MKLHKLVSGPAARAGSACPAARVTPLGSAAAHRHHHHRQVCRAAYVPDQRADQPSSARHPKHPHHHEEAGPQHTAFANQLEALRAMSVVVADTGEPALVAKIKPVDCTTNPRFVDDSDRCRPRR